MDSIRNTLLAAVAISLAGVAPSLAQQYATDPDPVIYSRLSQEHAALAHPNAVLPRTSVGIPTVAVASGRYATDPDAFIYGRLGQEHAALSHMDAVLPRTTLRGRTEAAAGFGSYTPGTDPDPRIRNRLRTENNVY
ncbi:hypothetical protein [Rhodoplanes azumiensis]|uniref:Uncharacterized protein n=1 Tax=Rhodoplanes azumiensis TaxID=1897628 RepID=A0ABW5AHY1_9BRAD